MALLKPALAAAAVVVVAATAACGLTHGPTPIEVTGARPSVHAILVAGEPAARVFIATVDAAKSPGSGGGPLGLEPLPGARVQLRAGDVAIPLPEMPAGIPACIALGPPNPYATSAPEPPAGPGCYGAEVPGGIAAGTRYDLTVVLPGGGVAHGIAIPPTPPQIVEPAPGAHLSVRTYNGYPGFVSIPVRWSGGADFAAVQTTATPVALYAGGAVAPDGICGMDAHGPGSYALPIDGDNTRLDLANIDCAQRLADGKLAPLDWDSLAVRVRLVVYDTTYARYLRAMSEPAIPEAAASAGITGALGVFAGAAAAEVPVILVRKREQPE